METDSARVADYFVICGLNANSRHMGVSNGCEQVLEGHSVSTLEYVTDITAIKVEDKIPAEYIVRSNTVGGNRAEFNVTNLPKMNQTNFYLCFKKSRDTDGPLSPIAEIRYELTPFKLDV